jgi:hypothetical protein
MRIVALLILAGCARGGSTASPATCVAARYAEPCGASAWQIGDRVAFVRGAGSPTGLARNVLIADNTFEVCGAFAGTVEDAECGTMPVFQATSFRVAPPIRRFVCGEGFGLFDDCMAADGTPALRADAGPLADADLDTTGHLACDRGGCRIAN